MCSTDGGIKTISVFLLLIRMNLSNLSAGLVVFVLTQRCSVTKTRLHRCVTHILLARDVSACFTSWQSDSFSLSHFYHQPHNKPRLRTNVMIND